MKFLDEITIVLFWIGCFGLSDTIIQNNLIYPSRNYLYLLFILIGIYLKIEK